MDILQDERVPLNWAFRFLSIVHTHHTANVTLAAVRLELRFLNIVHTHHRANVTLSAVRLEAQVPQHCPHTSHSECYTRCRSLRGVSCPRKPRALPTVSSVSCHTQTVLVMVVHDDDGGDGGGGDGADGDGDDDDGDGGGDDDDGDGGGDDDDGDGCDDGGGDDAWW